MEGVLKEIYAKVQSWQEKVRKVLKFIYFFEKERKKREKERMSQGSSPLSMEPHMVLITGP